jgi:hypothetical protein
MQGKYSGNNALWQGRAGLHRPRSSMVSCQSRNAVLALRADFTLLVIAGLDPAIQLFRKMDARVI